MSLPAALLPCAMLFIAGTVSAAGPAARAGEEWRYTIARGDTLIALRDRYLKPGIGWQRLQRLNRVDDPRRLRAGRSLRIPLAWMSTEDSAAELVFVHGQASVRRNAAAEPEPGRAGQRLPPGAVLQTGPQSSMSLRLADGSRVLVAPETRATLEQMISYGRERLPRARVRLDGGGLELKVQPSSGPQPRFEIRMPAATLGVRGTEFRARSDSERGNAVEVLEGRVGAAAASGSVVVAAGFGSIAPPGQPFSTPQPLPAAPDLSGVPARHVGTPVRMGWPAAASAYRARLLPGEGEDASLAEQLLGDAAVSWDALAPGRYRLRVRSVAANGLEGAEAEAAFEVQAAPPPPPTSGPAPPFPTLPAPGQQLSGTVVSFVWNAIEPDRLYRLQVAATPDFATLVADETDAGPSPYNVVQRDVRLRPGVYHWRVASLGNDGTPGAFSEARSFELREGADGPAK